MARWMLVFLATVLGPALGCAKISTPPAKSPLASAAQAPDSIALEITTLRFPLQDPEISGAVWNEVDEQQWPVELRRLLSANGFRLGLIGSRLPTRLEQALELQKQESETPASTDTNVVDFKNEPMVHGRLIQTRSGRRTHFICTGEHARHPELPILIKGPNGEVHGDTYDKVMGFLSIRAFPQGDGRVKLELTPAIEHGDPQRQYDPSEGMLRMEIRPSQEKYESLRTETMLSPGQMLLVATFPDRPGSLGYQFLTDREADQSTQKLLLIRLAQVQYDELFSLEELPKAQE